MPGAEPVVAELGTAAQAAASQELVELLERAVGHVVKVLIRGCDDSASLIVCVAQRLLDRDLWLALAVRRGTAHPDQALVVYFAVADDILLETNRRA